ncbi:MAG: hypothetical protein WBJ07_01550, partial [Limnochordia bacterium]
MKAKVIKPQLSWGLFDHFNRCRCYYCCYYWRRYYCGALDYPQALPVHRRVPPEQAVQVLAPRVPAAAEFEADEEAEGLAAEEFAAVAVVA